MGILKPVGLERGKYVELGQEFPKMTSQFLPEGVLLVLNLANYPSNMVENIWNMADGETQLSASGDKLVFWKNTTGTMNCHRHSGIQHILQSLPNQIKDYTLTCFAEHQGIIESLERAGYLPVELCFRDYLSWPKSEIPATDISMLQEAFDDDRYELVPMVVFANTTIENAEDDIAETSSLFIEFHKRGMAF